MVEQPLNQPAVLSSSCSTYYSVWPKTLSNLMPWEADDSESNFNWPWEPRPHAWGSTSLPPTLLFPFLSSLWIRNTSLTTESDHSAPVRPDKIKPTSTKRVNGRSTRRSNQVLKLTDYHISRHVASTFKRLTKWATPSDLNHFWLYQRGITTT